MRSTTLVPTVLRGNGNEKMRGVHSHGGPWEREKFQELS